MTGTLTLLAALAAGPVGDGLRVRAAAELPALVAALGSPRFADRDAAGRRLRAIGELALPAVRDAARASPDAEVRQRAADVRDAVERTQYQLVHDVAGDGHPLYAVAVSPDGREAAVGGEGRAVHVFDLRAGRLARTIPVGCAVYGLAYHPGGRSLAVATSANSMRPPPNPPAGPRLLVIDTAGGTAAPLPDTADDYLDVAFSPDGSRLLAVGHKVAEWWDVAARTRVAPAVPHAGWVWAAAVRPGGKRIAFGGQDRELRVWDVAPLARSAAATVPAGANSTSSAAYTPDGRRLLVGGFDGSVRVFDAGTHAPLRAVAAHPQAVWRVAVAPDGTRAAAAGFDGTVSLWDADTWDKRHTFRGGKRMYGLAFVPDRPAVVAVSEDGRLRVWRLPR